MFISPKSIRQSVAVSFMALAASQATAQLTVASKGHADWLPISGPVEKKICPEKGAPGDWFVAFDDSFAKQNIVFVTTNSCTRRFMKIDPVTGKLLSVHSANDLMRSRPVKVLNSVPAPDHWWQRSDLVPSEPQGEPSISGPAPGQWMCQIKFGSSQTLQAAPGAFIIPDAKRAFIVSTRRDPSVQTEKINETTSANYGAEGRYVCTIEPFIIIPTDQNIASSGGKWGSIGNIGKTPSPNVELATATAVVRSAELIYTGLAGISAMLGLKYSIEASGKTVDLLQAKGEDIVPLIMEGQAKTQAWLEDHPTALANTTLVIQSGTDLLMAFREMAGLSAVEMGQVVASVSKSAQAVGLIQDRNRVTTPGNCTPQEHAELQAEVNRACKSQGPRSCSPQLTPAPIAANNISKAMACIAARQKINNMCFMGGNNEHKEAIGQEHALIARCLKSVNRP